ncbi:DUF302 domain-containing protein [Marinoscillum sp. MHG1-6]|uniref:DUF302 domain-containing protein n=1 Tax=Marinoscillum sp. MHG1-6 TaxID=2959627 RepID=UPI002157F8EE|nr:DUF302 domain-containing protein [Marinoscillum sp. MHG1-6]
MKKSLLFTSLALITFIASAQNLTIYRSSLSVDETVTKIEGIIKSHDLKFFETVNHDAIAKERGKEIPPTRSILFEDPDLTTQLISCQPTTALDLPLEILVWEEYGDVYIGFMDPKFMTKRFMVSGCDETITSMTRLMVRVANEAIRR